MKDKKIKNLDDFLTKGEFYDEINPMKKDVSGLKKDVSELKEDVSGLKKDVSGLKKDVSGLKKDVSELKEDVKDLHQDLRHTENKLLLEIRLSRKESEDKMLKAMDKNNEFLIMAMCEQTQKIIDHMDYKFPENEKEHMQMCERISVCENKLGIKS